MDLWQFILKLPFEIDFTCLTQTINLIKTYETHL